MRVAIEQARGEKYNSIAIFVSYRTKMELSRVFYEMVQNSKTKRGRPRAYDPDTALARAMAAFWDTGYSATSLDDLSAATGMNRPSLCAAFGDKRALYRKALDQYRAMGEAAMADALASDIPLDEALRRVYRTALSVYFSGET